MHLDSKTRRQKDIETKRERKTKCQKDRQQKEKRRKCQKNKMIKTETPCHEACWVTTNDFINGDLKMNCNKWSNKL